MQSESKKSLAGAFPSQALWFPVWAIARTCPSIVPQPGYAPAWRLPPAPCSPRWL